jgi:hypothetical protein
MLLREAQGGRLLTHDDLRRYLMHSMGTRATGPTSVGGGRKAAWLLPAPSSWKGMRGDNFDPAPSLRWFLVRT